MTPRKTRSDPNVQEPYSETSIGRRVWASYLAKGYTRFSFARALGVSYSTVDAWDTDKSQPSLEMIICITKLLEVPVQNLLFGPTGVPEGAAPAHGLSVEAIRALLAELGATPQQKAALAAHQDSAEGRFQIFTKEYVVAWLAAYDAAKGANATEAEARAAALTPAITARAVSGAVAAGATRTASPAEVRAAVQRAQTPPPRAPVKAAAAKKTARRKR